MSTPTTRLTGTVALVTEPAAASAKPPPAPWPPRAPPSPSGVAKTPEEWQRNVDLNVSALLRITHAALPHLVAGAQDHPGAATHVGGPELSRR